MCEYRFVDYCLKVIVSLLLAGDSRLPQNCTQYLLICYQALFKWQPAGYWQMHSGYHNTVLLLLQSHTLWFCGDLRNFVCVVTIKP